MKSVEGMYVSLLREQKTILRRTECKRSLLFEPRNGTNDFSIKNPAKESTDSFQPLLASLPY